MNAIKTRFAPSPTGIMHIGSVRTALYAFLLAKHSDGQFIFRIEDTDRARLVEGSAENLAETLQWFGLKWDEGPIYQSQRLEYYQKYSQELLEKGFAYEKDGATWFKMPKEGQISWVDSVGNKTITINNSTQDDFVMIKSDKYPTYNFAVVVDDYLMGITHIIRGAEFIPSTPKHIALYQAFGWSLPTFVHLPLILGSDRSKLSKRHGAKGASEFKDDGFLPEAILNYMAFLGWTPKSGKEILDIEEMIKEFDLKDVHIAPAIFDIAKLEWMNGMYIRKLSDEELAKRLQEFLVDHPAKEKIASVVPLIKERITKLSDFVPLTDFIWEEPEYDMKVFDKIKVDNKEKILKEIEEEMKKMEKPWIADKFESIFRKLAEDKNIKVGDMFQLIRVAVSGQLVTPPLFESIKILGEEETLKRIRNVIEKYPNFDNSA